MTGTVCIRRPRSTWSACRCPRCRAIDCRNDKARAAGLLPARRSVEAWAVVDQHLAEGWTIARIAAAAGLPERTVRGAIAKRTADNPHLWSRGSVRALLTMHDDGTGIGKTSVVGARRRLQALAAIGWSPQMLQPLVGLHWRTLGEVRSGKTERVTPRVDLLVRAAYERLSMTPGSSQRSRTYAAAHGWVPPLAWDEDQLDDPAGRPAPTTAPGGAAAVDDAVLDRVLAGFAMSTTSVERAVLIPLLTERGMSDAQMAALCRCSDKTVVRVRQRLGVESQWADAHTTFSTKGKAA